MSAKLANGKGKRGLRSGRRIQCHEKVSRMERSGERQLSDAGPSNGKCPVVSVLLQLFESILKTILVAARNGNRTEEGELRRGKI